MCSKTIASVPRAAERTRPAHNPTSPNPWYKPVLPFAFAPNRTTLQLWAMGAAVLLCGGCHQLNRKCCPWDHSRDLPGYDPTRMVVNAGYNETRWMPLAPTFQSPAYVEHFADDVDEIPLPIAQDDSPRTPHADTEQASATTSEPAPVPVHPGESAGSAADAGQALSPLQVPGAIPVSRASQVPTATSAPRAASAPSAIPAPSPIRPVSATSVEDAQLLLDLIRS